MFNQGIRFSLAALLASTTINGVAQSPFSGRTDSPGIVAPQTGQATIQRSRLEPGQLRPVPRHGSVVETAPAPHDPQHPGWDLRWRRSPQAASSQLDASHSNATQVSAATATHPSAAVQTVNRVPQSPPQTLRVATESPRLSSVDGAEVAPVAWLGEPRRSDPFASPSELRVSQTQAGGATQSDTPDFFAAPFGDDLPTATSPQSEGRDDAFELPQPAEQKFVPPAADQLDTDNQLRGPIEFEPRATKPEPLPQESLSLPAPQPVQDHPTPAPRTQTPAPAPAPKADNGPSLREMLQSSPPKANQQGGVRKTENGSVEQLPAPAPTAPQLTPAPQQPFINPFDDRQTSEADRLDRDRLNANRTREDEYRPDGPRYGGGTDFLDPRAFSCEDFRQRIAEQTIDKVSLDVSPPFRPDEFDTKRYEELKADFDEKQVIRDWVTVDGRELATGRLRDLAYEKAVIEREDGSLAALPINRLSEGDIAYITENWGLPRECLIEQVAYSPRTWVPTTMTWKASNLCHNPLYFEDVNLERYGHTHGPVLEPFVQSAHFFANIAVLPYKMGVHAPQECQYALGYYRPGDCAPWIKPPVPISARGAIAQAATMTGLFWLIP